LFSSLPDGSYAIEYVLGEGNERVLLRVDIRQGEAVITGDDSEAGMLKLEVLERNDSFGASPTIITQPVAESLPQQDIDRSLEATDFSEGGSKDSFDQPAAAHLDAEVAEPGESFEAKSAMIVAGVGLLGLRRSRIRGRRSVFSKSQRIMRKLVNQRPELEIEER
jgi:hypothetical protein